MADDKNKILEEIEQAYFGTYNNSITQKEALRYLTESGKKSLERSRAICEAGVESYLKLPLPTVKEAKKLPHKNEEERLFRKESIVLAKQVKLARKTAATYYKDGIKEFDPNIFNVLNRAAESTREDIEKSKAALSEARKKSDKNSEAEAEKMLKKNRDLIISINKQLRKARKVASIYYKAAKPYLDAKKLTLKYKMYEESQVL